MEVQFEDNSIDEQLRELKRLKSENKKLSRELAHISSTMEHLKSSVIAQHNISAVVSAERAKQEKHIQVIIENSPELLLLFDKEIKAILTSRSFLSLAKMDNEFLAKEKTFRQLFSPFADDLWIAKVERLSIIAIMTNEVQSIEGEIDICGCGSVGNYIISLAPFSYEQATADGVLMTMRNVTVLINEKKRADAASKAKSTFLATMSHEIRTPMNAIIGLTDMLQKTQLSELQQMYADNIKKSSEALLSLVTDILDFSKIESGKLEVVDEYLDLYNLIEHFKSTFGILYHQKGLEFIVEVDPDIPQVIITDKVKLKQILTNLLSNALKYTNTGSVKFHVYSTGVVCLHFDVIDTGIGIKDEDISRLFDPFEQLDREANKNVVGTGLGLTITSSLCKLMGGYLSVESEYGKGTTFSVTLALRQGDVSDLEFTDENMVHFSAPSASALIVDDIEINLVISEAMLEEYSLNITLASSGKEAIAAAKEGIFDIVFMDHMMPEMDGLETTAELRKLGRGWENVPIIALSANATIESRTMFKDAGLNDFVAKPIDTNLLNLCLRRWLPKEKILFSDAK